MQIELQVSLYTRQAATLRAGMDKKHTGALSGINRSPMTSTRREVILIPYDTQRPIPSLYQLAVIEQGISWGKRQWST